MSLQCVFVNTQEPPVSIKRLNQFKYQIDGKDTYFYELCEVVYKHPEAPEVATVSLLEWLEVKVTPGTETLIKQTIEAMKGIRKISELIGPRTLTAEGVKEDTWKAQIL